MLTMFHTVTHRKDYYMRIVSVCVKGSDVSTMSLQLGLWLYINTWVPCPAPALWYLITVTHTYVSKGLHMLMCGASKYIIWANCLLFWNDWVSLFAHRLWDVAVDRTLPGANRGRRNHGNTRSATNERYGRLHPFMFKLESDLICRTLHFLSLNNGNICV